MGPILEPREGNSRAGPIRLLLEANLENAGAGGGQRGHDSLFWPDVHCVHKVVLDPSRSL